MTKKILVVEDNPHNMRLIEQLLEDIDEQLVCTKAENSEAAIAAAKKTEFSLVLMDISLPDMDGITITNTIKEFPHMKSVPFIVVTAHVMDNDESNFKGIFNDYISKPIDDEIFEAKIKRWIGDRENV